MKPTKRGPRAKKRKFIPCTCVPKRMLFLHKMNQMNLSTNQTKSQSLSLCYKLRRSIGNKWPCDWPYMVKGVSNQWMSIFSQDFQQRE
mmetsp:Transcript_10917/g.19785  ORF Transcript_10917/g.19785 Transcript_10917/m.19785 type:complete len:88 (-) Transcript_10917:41-304(-)